MVKIHIFNTQKTLKFSQSSVKKTVLAILAFYSVKCDEINIYFISQPRICRMHGEFFNDFSTTDCISFPIDALNESPCFLGGIFICPWTAQKYIQKHGGNVYDELTLYLAHGVLHLLGYNDIEPEDRRKMKAEEKKIIAHLNQRDIKISL